MIFHDKKYCSGLTSSILYFLFAVLLFCSPLQAFAEWEINPTLSLRETYTDNVRLGGGGGGVGVGGFGGSGPKQDDFITQINPGLSLLKTGRRFNVNASYLMNNLIFAKNSNLNRTRHLLSANSTAELLEDLFFIDTNARMIQQNTTLFGPQATDNTNVTGNRANIRAYQVSPYMRHRFKNFASTELRYTHGIVEAGAGGAGLGNSQRNSYLLSLISGDAFRILNWGLNYSHNSIHIDGSNTRPGRTIELERSIADLQYNITPRFGLTATGGYERNSFISIRGKSSSPTWTVGFTWIPGERTDISFRAGQRFFGDTYFAEANHRTRLTTWSAGYNESLTTFNQGALSGSFNPGLVSGFGDSGSALTGNNFLTNRLFLQKRLQASASVNGVRNTLVFTVFNMSRKALSPEEDDIDLVGSENASLLNKTRQTGANVSLSHRVSQQTTANINASLIRFKFLTNNTRRDTMIFSASLNKQLQENLSGALIFRHLRFSSDQFSGSNANSITASLNMNF
jgi:uncharacterized protein (PEP-CTERM system associated)